MATLCKNCNHALVYDPAVRKVACAFCGSLFEAEEVESQAKKYRETERVLSKEEVFGDDEAAEEFLEGYVYTCSECGGEIVLHGSESSTKCVYCGNPNVVFSRMSKEMLPDYIIPFTVTRDQALSSIREVVKNSIFLPKEVKQLKVDDVRGIYLPYWIVNANHEETAVVQIKSTNGITKYQYTGRTGAMCLSNFTVDGCQLLSDESSTRLEPFDLSQLRPFDEDYLLGFYSNSSDITYEDMYLAVERRGKEIFEQNAINDTPGKNQKIVGEVHETAILNDYKYALLPVWFVTFMCEGKHHTVLVNGQTGKIVCGLPWDKKKFWITTSVCGILLFLLSVLLLTVFFEICGIRTENVYGEYTSINMTERFIASFGFMAFAVWGLFGWTKLSKINKQIKLTRSDKTFKFVKKRQG